MRLRQFIIIEQAQLNEVRSEDNFAIKKLDDEQWAAWVEQNCGDYLPRAGRYPIYRGFSEKTAPVDLGFKNTNEFTRRSANTTNYFTLWLDNAPQWRDYPRRSKSFVGSSNFYNADLYGVPYQLFPANDAKIGICPKDDIWNSFSQILGDDVNNLNNLLQTAFIDIFDRRTAKRAETNWNELRSLLEIVTPGELIEAIENNLGFLRVPKQFTNYSTLLDYLEGEITPERHGFKHATPATYSTTSVEGKEVWVQGKVALLNVYTIFDDNNGHLFPRTTALLAKYNIERPN